MKDYLTTFQKYYIMKENTTEILDYKSILKNSFITAIIGAGLCLVSIILTIFFNIKGIENYDNLTQWTAIIGFIVWGIGMLMVGGKSNDIGYENEDASEYGMLIIMQGIILGIIFFFASKESYVEGIMGYIWIILEILFPCLMFVKFQDEEEGKSREKNFEGIGIGMGLAAIAVILMFLSIKIPVWTVGDSVVELSTNRYGEVYMKANKFAIVGKFIMHNFNLITTIFLILKGLGYLISFCSTCGITDYTTNVRRYLKKKDSSTLNNETIESLSGESNNL